MTTDPATVALVAAVFLLAGFVKGVVGLGLPSVAVGLLGLAMAPAEAAALLVVPSLATNAWQMAVGPGLAPLLRRLWPMMAGVALGTLAASGLLAASGPGATAALGAALVLYAALALATAARPLRVPPRAEHLASPLVGAATGVATAATGVFVVPAVPYLGALAGMGRDALVQALGLSFMVSTVALAAALAREGLFGTAALGASALALAPALAGMALGARARAALSPAAFRQWFLLGLLALGAHLLWRGLA